MYCRSVVIYIDNKKIHYYKISNNINNNFNKLLNVKFYIAFLH